MQFWAKRTLWKALRAGILGVAVFLVPQNAAFGQTIQFSIYVASNLDATKDQDLDLGMSISGSGTHEVNLGDPGMGVFSIAGNEQLDVIVSMTADAELTNPSTSHVIPFTLEFAYANRGENNINHAVVGVGGTARFQLRQRESGPPGAPPTPANAGFTPNTATAYIYVYGSMYVGAIDPGTYTGNVNLSVTYD